MVNLPKWVVTDKFPALYDMESATAIEMVAKLYGSMQTLISEYNEYVSTLNKDIDTFESELTTANECFKSTMEMFVNNFIACVDVKIDKQNAEIAGAIDEIIRTAESVTEQAIANGKVLKDATARESVEALNRELTTLENRMNTFTTLAEGSTTADAELIDIRVKANGKVATSAGNAVREQIIVVNEAINALNDKTGVLTNELTLTDLLDNHFINFSNGVSTENADYMHTDFISVLSGDKFVINKGVVQFAYYLNETYVEGVGVDENMEGVLEFIVPINCNQVRFSLYKPKYTEETGVFMCSFFDYIMNKYTDNGNLDKMVKTEKDITNAKTGLNLIDFSSVKEGEFYTLNDGVITIMQSPTAKSFNAIFIEANKTYFYNDVYGYFCLLIDVNGNITQLTETTGVAESGHFICEHDSILLPTVAVISGINVSPKIYRATETVSKPYIECGEDKEYTTLRSAIAKGTELGCKVVVHAGVYDLTEEFADVLENHNGTGCELGNGIEVVFMAGAYVKANVDVSNEWAYTFFEPFVARGDFVLDGLNIEATNTRYCVHDDVAGIGTHHHVYKNCIMKYTNEHASETYIQCIGGGMGEHSYIDIIGGKYTTINNGSRGAEPISYHNGITDTCDGKIFIKDVWINGRFRFGMYGGSTIKTPVFVNGCSMGEEIYLHYETADYNNENFEITAWNNEIRN